MFGHKYETLIYFIFMQKYCLDLVDIVCDQIFTLNIVLDAFIIAPIVPIKFANASRLVWFHST